MWTEEEISYLKNNYAKKSYKEISINLNKTRSSVISKARKLKITLPIGKNPIQFKKQIKNSFDEYFFENFNLLNCYWAGFLAADGNISLKKYKNTNNKKCLNLQISTKDLEHIRRFVSDIKFTGKISIYKRKNGIEMCNITIISNKLCEDLEKNFNITQNKTFTLSPPVLKDENLINSYIIGYIDGDGCIRRQNKHISIDARGTEKIIFFIKERFTEICKNYKFGNTFKNGSIYLEDSKKNHYRYKITGRASEIIINNFKKYNIPYLKRKWNIDGE